MASPTERKLRFAKLTERLDPTRRLVDVAFQFEVWGCSCGKSHAPPSHERKAVNRWLADLADAEHTPIAVEVMPQVYGGRYDKVAEKYVGKAERVERISCHRGQVPVLTFREPGVMRLLALGTPGTGKSFAAERAGLRFAVDRANSIGALVAPTGDRRQILWRDFLELVEPLGWIADVSHSRKEISLLNGSVIQVLAAKASSSQYGNPLQGRSWDWVVVDESQNVTDDAHTEIATRGRRAGEAYQIIETATNAQVPSFRVRLEQLKSNPQARIVRFTGEHNPWITPQWWSRLLGDLSERDFREKILVEDVAPDRLVYPEFRFADHVKSRRVLPQGTRDITEAVLAQAFRRHGLKWIVAQDFGVLVTTSILLKAFDVPDYTEGVAGRFKRVWYACDEITSGHGITADVHARRIIERYDPEEVIVIADPHWNTKDTDKSDYHLFQQQGLHIVPAAPGGKIRREHRITMMNILLREGRFLVDCDDNRVPRCRKLVESFTSLQRNEYGEAETDKKDRNDMTHWTAAAGYGVFPFEKLRGQSSIQLLKPSNGMIG